jgi:hypothetical protein
MRTQSIRRVEELALVHKPTDVVPPLIRCLDWKRFRYLPKQSSALLM